MHEHRARAAVRTSLSDGEQSALAGKFQPRDAPRHRRGKQTTSQYQDNYDVAHLLGQEVVESNDVVCLTDEHTKPDLDRLVGEMRDALVHVQFEERKGNGKRASSRVYQNTHGWSTVALRTLNGELGEKGNQLRRLKRGMKFRWTEAMAHMPYLRSYLKSLGTRIYLVRMMCLKAGGRIHPHTDGFAFKDREKMLRCHIPLVTHPDVEFTVANHPYHLRAGHLWFTRVDKTHSVVNNSPVDRVHLVIDLAPRGWLRQAVGLSPADTAIESQCIRAQLSEQRKRGVQFSHGRCPCGECVRRRRRLRRHAVT